MILSANTGESHELALGSSVQVYFFKSDIGLSDISLLVDVDYKISHFNWFSDEELIVYLGAGPDGEGYYLLHINDQIVTKIQEMPHELDGHPTVSTTKDYVITDTIVNKYSNRELYYYDITKQNLLQLGEFFSPTKYSLETRCDLHPRLDCKNNRVCIDSAHTGKRSMYVLDLDSINN